MRFFQISPLFWADEKTKAWDEPTRNLAFYILTNPHRNLEGLYRLPYGYILEDLDWSPDEVSERMDRLISDGFIAYDDANKVVLIPKAMKFHSPGAPKQLDGAMNALAKVPDTPLYSQFLEACETYCEPLHKRLTNG